MNIERVIVTKSLKGELMIQKFINAGIMPVHFQSKTHQEMYNYIIQTRKDKGVLPTAKELSILFKFVPDPDEPHLNSHFIIDQFKNYYKRATMTQALAESSKMVDDPDEAAKILHKHLTTLHTHFSVARDVNLSESVPNVLQACKDALLKGGVTGIPTPWKDLDKAIGGFNKEEFILITGRPKCLAEGTLVTLADGTRMPIEEVVRKKIKRVPSFDGTSFATQPVIDWFVLGKKECLTIKTRSGRSITCATTHPMLTMGGYEEAQNLTTDSFLAVPRVDISSKAFIRKPWQEVYLTALLIAEGCLRKSGEVLFSSADKEIIFLAKFACLKFSAKLTKTGKYDYRIIKKKRDNSKTLVHSYVDSLGLRGKRSHEKFLPPFVFQLPPQQKALFMATLINTDGCICKATNGMAYMEYSSSSEKLADDVQHLLCLMGIRSSKMKHSTPCLPTYQVAVYSQAMTDLMGMCAPFLLKRKYKIYEGANNHNKKEKDNDVVILSPAQFKAIRQDMLDTGLPFKTILGIEGKPNVARYGQGKPISISVLKRIAASVPSETLEKIVSTDLFYDKITSIVRAGQKECYDICVGGTSNYIASDFVTHNSGKTWYALYMATHCVKMGYKVLFVSKEMSQRLLERRYIGLRSSVPYNELKNGNLTTKSKLKLKLLDFSLRKETGRFILIEDDTAGNTGVSFIDSKVEEHKPDIVFIDGVYLLADDNGSTDERPRLRNISRDCKRMASRRKIPVVAVLQLNRDKVSKSTGEGGMNAVYGTDGFIQDTDCAIEIIRNRELDDEGCRMLKVIAAREGENLALKTPFNLDTYPFNQVYESSNEEAPQESEVEMR